MPNCGSFICDEDMVTFEEFKDTGCVGIQNDKCVSCETAKRTLKADPQGFYKNAAMKLFGEKISNERLEKLWTDLNDICKIKYLVLKKEKIVFIAPDVENAIKNYNTIITYIPNKYIPNLMAMIQIIETSDEVTTQVAQIQKEGRKANELDRKLKQKYMYILREGKWKCLLVHHPRELPYVLALILQELADDPEKINIFIETIDSVPEACAEASFDLMLRKMS